MILVIGAGTCSISADTPAADDQPEPKVTVQEVVTELAAEARAVLKDQGVWARKEADYATDKQLSLDSDVVIKSLGRRLDRNPAVDGYIKWQLLSFKADLPGTNRRQQAAIVKARPKLVVRPDPTPKHQKVFSAAIDKPPPPKLADMTKQAYDAFYAARKQVDHANMPNLHYRDALAKQLPHEGGVRLTYMLIDSQDRFDAADMSFREVNSAVLRQAKTLIGDPVLDRQARKKLVSLVKRISKHRSSAVREIQRMATGQVHIRKVGRLFNLNQPNMLIADLAERDRKEVKKLLKAKK